MSSTDDLMKPIDHSDNHQHFDAIIVGASIAGCIGALELANNGWRVAVVEQRKSLTHYKKVCTHILHPAAIARLRHIGVFDELEKQSAQMTCMEIAHDDKIVRYPSAGKLTAANIERRDLDPVLKKTLLKQANITLFPGFKNQSLIKTGNRVKGIVAQNSAHENLFLHAPLVIGADGRQSHTAKLAGGKTHSKSSDRIAIFSYFETATHLHESKVWALDRGREYMGYFPNNNRTLLSWYLPRASYQSEAKDHDFERVTAFLADKGITVGKRQESIMVAKDTSSQTCQVGLKHIALIGDAKLSPDPLTGIGCQWAIESAGLLANCVGKPPSASSLQTLVNARIRLGIGLYNLIHMLRFRFPSSLMNLISNHGYSVFNQPVYTALSWLTREKPTQTARSSLS